MVAKQRIRMANEKHSKNITQRGNVAKTLVDHINTGFSWRGRTFWKLPPEGVTPESILRCVRTGHPQRIKMDSLEETSPQPSALPSYLPDHTEHKDGHVRRPGRWLLLPCCRQVEGHGDLQQVYSKRTSRGQ
ncbi:LOW QUALITY PROTEIN: stress-associated endoplasmic reticulum protein 2 [Peromyscus eremicus]|uniref:LOW QUALITY PROTEIN: stress-associated endoplasmic reticulum protein 2 n=1 Tax=Peromyscus eremicus TaxID=42410 RepID=UPI0027DCCAEF|nr:LOW QUALITY PROTEIN: stress-associated endoplasmic reticulum protein 2 [Peromyscus eremicus]